VILADCGPEGARVVLLGRLVPIRGYGARHNEEYEHTAFLPDPLPTEVVLEQRTYRAVTDATAAVARLDQASVRLPNPCSWRGPAIRRQTVSTSALEGTYAALDDVLEVEFSG